MSKDRKPQMAMFYPVAGRRIRDPETRALLAPAGEMKPMSSYWIRKLQDEDVTMQAPAAPAPLAMAEQAIEEAAPAMNHKKKGKE